MSVTTCEGILSALETRNTFIMVFSLLRAEMFRHICLTSLSLHTYQSQEVPSSTFLCHLKCSFCSPDAHWHPMNRKLITCTMRWLTAGTAVVLWFKLLSRLFYPVSVVLSPSVTRMNQLATSGRVFGHNCLCTSRSSFFAVFFISNSLVT